MNFNKRAIVITATIFLFFISYYAISDYVTEKRAYERQQELIMAKHISTELSAVENSIGQILENNVLTGEISRDLIQATTRLESANFPAFLHYAYKENINVTSLEDYTFELVQYAYALAEDYQDETTPLDQNTKEELQSVLKDVSELNTILEPTLTIEAGVDEDFKPLENLDRYISKIQESSQWRYLNGKDVAEAD